MQVTPAEVEAERERILGHITQVQGALREVRVNLWRRGQAHDASKLQAPELEGFAAVRRPLDQLEYGGPEYAASLAALLSSTLSHHYAHNRHHPEHHPGGVEDMTLLDLLEMLADWYVAGKATKDGSMARSFAVNAERFAISPELLRILRATAEELGWA